VLDELSYITFGRSSAELLFQTISNRYELGSIIVTTNLPFSRWTELFVSDKPDTPMNHHRAMAY